MTGVSVWGGNSRGASGSRSTITNAPGLGRGARPTSRPSAGGTAAAAGCAATFEAEPAGDFEHAATETRTKIAIPNRISALMTTAATKRLQIVFLERGPSKPGPCGRIDIPGARADKYIDYCPGEVAFPATVTVRSAGVRSQLS